MKDLSIGTFEGSPVDRDERLDMAQLASVLRVRLEKVVKGIHQRMPFG